MFTLLNRSGIINVIIDADACPSIDLITDLCKRYSINLEIYCDVSHVMENDYGRVYIVDQSFQNVDNHIVNKVTKNDIVVTQDYGLASLVLMKGAKAINPSGLIYTNFNIDSLLLQRHLTSESRRAGIRSRGPKKRTQEDDNNLINNLDKLIKEMGDELNER